VAVRKIKIFITYSHSDSALSQKLVRDLRARGLDAFFDVDSISGGDRIAETISHGLAECDVYIPILSFKALDSLWCRDEINAAIALSNDSKRNGRPKIVSVLAEDCRSVMWPLLLGRLYFSFEGDYNAALKELVERGLGIGLSSAVTTAVARKAIIESVKPDLNVKKNQNGLLIHLKFVIDGYKQTKCLAVAYFYLAGGVPLKGIDDKYLSTDGQVSTGESFSPGYEQTTYEDLQLFVPYSRLNLPSGAHELEFHVNLWNQDDMSSAIATSETIRFNYNQPKVVVNQVWADHNVTRKEDLGMLIHLDFDISDHKGKKCKAIAYFYYDDGKILLGTDGQYGTTENQVCASTEFVPEFDETYNRDRQIFIPNSQLHNPSRNQSLKFCVEIHGEDGEFLAKSDWSHFSLV
jgi:hypothetical protein